MPLLAPFPAALPEGTALVVGLSGGLDSSVLLHALAGDAHYRSRLRAVHVDHGLHAESDRWARHCQTLCAALDVPLSVHKVEVDRSGGDGPEAAARRARLAAFAQELRAGDVLVLAHHRDDQAETFLLRALRASGPDGLAAMRPWRPHGSAWLWRPLLERARAELLAYAQSHDLRWIDDPSNEEHGFDRNFLRHRVLPVLRERWPQADAALAASASLCADSHDLLLQGDRMAMAEVATIDPHAVSRSALMRLPQTRRARVLRHWIASLGLPALPANGIARIETELLPADADAQARFDWHGHRVYAWRDVLHAAPSRSPLPTDWRRDWDGGELLALPEGGELRLVGVDALPVPLTVHARQGGERIQLPGRTHRHALKHVLQDLGVPPWLRERLPLLSTPDGELWAAGDLVLSAGFDTWLRERGARLEWRES